MVVTSVDLFVDELRASNLLTDDQLKSALAESGTLTAVQFSERLVEQELLTAWQAEQLMSGNHISFFIGRYRLLGCLGEGAVGIVYKALDPRMNRTVVLKVGKKDAKASLGERFDREIRAIGALKHPNIIAALDASMIDDHMVLVMEFVDGRDLEKLLEEAEDLPDVRWSCECIRQAALGLQCAFDAGIIHRDIKPGNILVTTEPKTDRPLVKILDMGLARFTEAKQTTITQTGQVLGTVDYIAPEQVGSSKDVDIRADIYSLGCTLFRMLTGHVAFEDQKPLMRFLARTSMEHPRVSTQRPDIDSMLDDIVFKMVARDPNDRFQTPAEVAAALRPFSLPETAPSDGVAASEPTDAESCYMRGLSHARRQEYDQAIAAYTEALHLNPAMAKAYLSRSHAYNVKSKADRIKALELDPKLSRTGS